MNIYMRFTQLTLAFFTFSMSLGCLQSTDNQQENKDAGKQTGVSPVDSSNIVSLTTAQYTNAKIKLSMIQSQVLSNQIETTGIIDVPPENLISITPLLGGVLESTPLHQGSAVRKGQLVAVLENPEFITLQQEYLEAKSQLQLATTEYARQQKLAEEKINSQKVLQKARSIYESARIRSNALRQRLQLINVSADQIKNDHIQRRLNIYAPVSGFIIKVNVNKGKYIGDKETMFQMVTNAPLHIDLKVFEQDMAAIKEGQKVRFKVAGDTTTRLATVELIEKSIGSDNTLTIHSVAEESGLNFMPGAYVQAKIETSPKPVPALPEKAVVRFEDKNYIFVQLMESRIQDSSKKDYSFKMIPVGTGTAANGFLEIKPPFDQLSNQQIVIQGAYDLLSQLKNEAE